MIKALGQVKQQTGIQTHLLHTTGAKLFSGHAGMPTDRELSDLDSDLYELQKNTKAPHEVMGEVCTILTFPFASRNIMSGWA
jgi:hypothetical protein